MEGRKKKASSSSSSSPPSSSSLTSELFGSRENPSSPSSSSGIFGSIFAPPPKVLGRESMRQETVTGGWNDKTSKSGDVDRNREQQENLGSAYQQDQRVQPCHLSSSIYYGGPDVYFQPQNPTVNSTNKKDGGEDDSGSASRGNWWQGSLYY
ncbi:hypothetical protein CARUB_v10002196mg [Capsella rubella]|uniref:Uncharacterized protein n=1 Tax=Capsella rubella TaxID=81985 RepID=R0H9T5_9BRAS|nr:uncharacterized protein LOC17881569 [Capsella rubella]EOA21740.1 hypothetical protein CARUB_v10002196mg [Capsella rubella]